MTHITSGIPQKILDWFSMHRIFQTRAKKKKTFQGVVNR